MLNITTEKQGIPQAILVRGIQEVAGPGRVAKMLKLDKSFYGHDLCSGKKLWIEANNSQTEFQRTPRININYAPEPWLSKPYRYISE